MVKAHLSMMGFKDADSIPGLGEDPHRERNGNLLHYSCMENSIDRGTGLQSMGPQSPDTTEHTPTDKQVDFRKC